MKPISLHVEEGAYRDLKSLAERSATLECAGVQRPMTLNRRDYEVFPFLELVGIDVE